eukprot:TRINITY_DN2389_c0_g1_i39.p2 TRINITY_DN2389_c0_g1~~TRINITY_DN2389_c0_g1_i39.p2  ORF type:complete len:216 (-),score=43.98 TRINITY_DN2389_c0_g1_i39:826-1473(-)
MPRIISYLGQEVFSMQDIQNLKKTTSFLKRVDVCIHCLNKENYLSWDFLQKVIKMEWNSNGAIFLYRGCENIQNDDPFKISETGEPRPHSLSFGSSLFSGLLHDRTATVYNYYKKQKKKNVYVLKLDLKHFFKTQISPEKVFFFPPLPCLAQLYGIGELFHPRTKIFLTSWNRGKRDLFVSGILRCSYFNVPEFLLSPFPLEKEAFQNYKSIALS